MPESLTEAITKPKNKPGQNNLHKYNSGVPIEQIIDYRLKGLSSPEIGKLLNISDSTVRVRIAKHTEDIDNTELFRKHRARVFAFQARRILQAITDADIEKASLRDKVIAASVLYDKERLESGLSTQNLAYIDIIKAKQSVSGELETIEAELVEAGIDPKSLSNSEKNNGDNGNNRTVPLQIAETIKK